MLGENLAHYKRMQENGTVDIIEFHTTDGQKFGIGNVAAIQLLLSVAVTELERQLHTARFGDIPERLEESREYKTARKLEQALNDMGFNPERFAETLPYFHKTLEQAFFRVMKACIIGMAKREPNHIDGLLRTEYRPDTSAEPTAANLWKEMLRFKECISRLENAFFCIYFPPEQSGEFPRTEWFGQVLKEGVPQGIRLTTIDLKKDRNVALDESPEVVHIRPRFDMAAALHNRMARADAGNDLIAPENRFKQQVTAVMDCTRKQDLKPLEKEIRKLLDIAGELKDANIRISALFIASEACYAIREYKSSMKYSDKTIREAEKAMKDGEAAGYSYWKMAVSMKAAILTAEKKREEAVALYEGIAGKAVERKDPYYVMEGYRMCGFLRYEEGKLEQAFEYFLLALAGGSYLSEDIRRSSTFTYAAHLALHTGRQVRAPIDIEVLERQLHEWLGEDWKELVENPSMRQAEARRKGGIFN